MEAAWVSAGLLSLILVLLAYIGDMLKTALANITAEVHDLRGAATEHRDYDDERFAVLDKRVTGLGG